MSNEQILTKAIEKAIASGWPMINQFYYMVAMDEDRYKAVIFNHDFAKALWGTELYGFKCEHCGLVSSFEPAWKVRLQQMVIADDPIDYLGKHL